MPSRTREEVAALLKRAGLAVVGGYRANEKINAKIRNHSLAPRAGNSGGRPQRGGSPQRGDPPAGWGAAQEILSLDEAIASLVDEATPPDVKREGGFEPAVPM